MTNDVTYSVKPICTSLLCFLLFVDGYAEGKNNVAFSCYQTYLYEYASYVSQMHEIKFTRDSFSMKSSYCDYNIMKTSTWVNSEIYKEGTYVQFNDTVHLYDKSGSQYAVLSLRSSSYWLSISIIHDTLIKKPRGEKRIEFSKVGEIYQNWNMKYLKQVRAVNKITHEASIYNYTIFDSFGQPLSAGKKCDSLNIGYNDTFLLIAIFPSSSYTYIWNQKPEASKWLAVGHPYSAFHRFHMGKWRKGKKVGIWKYYIKSGEIIGGKYNSSNIINIKYKARSEKYNYKRGLIWSKNFH
jgi:hypothetical protein